MNDTYSFDYSTLVDFFGEETIINRVSNLYRKMDAFISECDLEESVHISESLLRRAVIDYFADIFRLRTFHGIDRVNRHKIVAYTAFWLLRRQPIQLRENVADKEECAFVNENFVASFIAYACVTPSSSPEQMYNSRISLNEEAQKAFLRFLSDLRYHLRYRLVDARNLELMLSAYETGFSLGTSNPCKIAIDDEAPTS